MIAYKFLTADGTGPFTGHRWPLPGPDGGGPGEWVEAPADPCRSGVHACRVRDLPFWIGRHQLYALELAGDLVEHRSKVVAPRGRLVRRVDAWDADACDEYTRDCADRVHELAAGAGGRMDAWAALVEPSLPEGPCLLGYMAARVAEELDGREAFWRERARQGAWLGRRLGLE